MLVYYLQYIIKNAFEKKTSKQTRTQWLKVLITQHFDNSQNL